ncbi:unnamed protein product [Prorocentrum cordatum]|uniref:Uncharacterized protein n=1 Tax=Prorocentrum cordatum TaxID=2364126 RepID=A0ABN9W1V5_9DINO|nr:unnamed protein product [Polarella glacialis]
MALSEPTNVDEVSVTVEAFMEAQRPAELIELLEESILHISGRQVARHGLHQPPDCPDSAAIALEQFNLSEGSVVMRRNCNMCSEPMETLPTNVEDTHRAIEIAACCNDSAAGHELGRAQPDSSQVPEAIKSHPRAEDAADCADVIQDVPIDAELGHSHAKTDRVADVEEVISGANAANFLQFGDRVYEKQACKAARNLCVAKRLPRLLALVLIAPLRTCRLVTPGSIKYSDQMVRGGGFGSSEGAIYFFGAILSPSTEPEFDFNCAQAASGRSNAQEIELACRENTSYDRLVVDEFLWNFKLLNPVNPANCPFGVGVLVDMGGSADIIKNLLQAQVAGGGLDRGVAMVDGDASQGLEAFREKNALHHSAMASGCFEGRRLVNVTNVNVLFGPRAREPAERQSPAGWAMAMALNEAGEKRRQVIDQIVGIAQPGSTSADEVSATAAAFIEAQQPPADLIELLERMALLISYVSKNRNLQNLLVVASSRADRTLAVDYVGRLGSCDDAMVIHKKGSVDFEPMERPTTNVEDIQRAVDFATRCNEGAALDELGRGQRDSSQVPEAIESCLMAVDAADYAECAQVAARVESFEKVARCPAIARTMHKYVLNDIELQVTRGTNAAESLHIGGRPREERAIKAAMLAGGMTKLGAGTQAAVAARKANDPEIWGEASIASGSAGQFRCAAIFATHIIAPTLPDCLEKLANHLERPGSSEQLISPLAAGPSHELARMGMRAELGALRARHKLSNFARTGAAERNIPKPTAARERRRLRGAAAFLYSDCDECDQAPSALMAHGASAYIRGALPAAMRKAAVLSANSSVVDNAWVVQLARRAERRAAAEFLEAGAGGRAGRSDTWTSKGVAKYLEGGNETMGALVDQRICPRVVEGELRYITVGGALALVIRAKLEGGGFFEPATQTPSTRSTAPGRRSS